MREYPLCLSVRLTEQALEIDRLRAELAAMTDCYARIAELEAANSEIAVEALRDHRELRARAERAEADADSLRTTIDNMRAMNIKLTFEATGKVLAAEAERDALREAARPFADGADILPKHWDAIRLAVRKARAALKTAPAGREE